MIISCSTDYDYTSYGKLEGNGSNLPAANPFTYTGREDDGTGLLYYRARYYDPELEVFISQDPLGDKQRYVGGNPLSFNDPLGLEAGYAYGPDGTMTPPIIKPGGTCEIAGALLGLWNFLAGDDINTLIDPTASPLERGLATAGFIPAGKAGKFLKLMPGNPFRGVNAAKDAYNNLKKFHGIDPSTASKRLHKIKDRAGLGGSDDVAIGRTGDVYNAKTGQHIGTLTDKALGK